MKRLLTKLYRWWTRRHHCKVCGQNYVWTTEVCDDCFERILNAKRDTSQT